MVDLSQLQSLGDFEGYYAEVEKEYNVKLMDVEKSKNILYKRIIE